MGLIRLQKYLSSSGICSRRKGEEYIKKGYVSVNGETVTEMGTKVDPDKDVVEFKGAKVKQNETYIYIALNKPAGYVSSCSQKNVKIVLDLVNVKGRVYPVGRLDKASTGLLLLTNDGRVHHALSHPSFDHEKEYEVRVKAPVSNAALKRMADGIILDGVKTRSAKVRRLSKDRFNIILKQGKNRQIRRMVKKVGNEVVILHRHRISHISIGGLKKGEWRYLTPKEKKTLIASIAEV